MNENIEIDIQYRDDFVSLKRKHIRRIMNYIRNKGSKVTFIDEVDNSMGFPEIRKYTGIVKSFELSEMYKDVCEYSLNIHFKDGHDMEIWLTTDYQIYSKYNKKEFISGFCNCGPYCYFKILRG